MRNNANPTFRCRYIASSRDRMNRDTIENVCTPPAWRGGTSTHAFTHAYTHTHTHRERHRRTNPSWIERFQCFYAGAQWSTHLMLSSPLLFIKSTVRRRLMWTRRLGQSRDSREGEACRAKLKIYLPCRSGTCRESLCREAPKKLPAGIESLIKTPA